MSDAQPGLRTRRDAARRAHAPRQPRRGRRPAAPADARARRSSAWRATRRGSRGSVSVILWGPPGTGKTTLAQAIAHSSGRRFVELSAVTAGVRDVRQVMEEALHQPRPLRPVDGALPRRDPPLHARRSRTPCCPGVENGWVILVAATTENPSFSVISPLLSRSLLLTLETAQRRRPRHRRRPRRRRPARPRRPLRARARGAGRDHPAGVRRRPAGAHRARGGIASPRPALDATDRGDPDADDSRVITDRASSRCAVDRALLRYDRNGDEHYDVISAFIKSMRGSDVDASLHYLARMIEAGEDPRFIARRIIVLASEDIGMADPQALVIAVAAADAVQFIGMPEGRIPLAAGRRAPGDRRRSPTPPTSPSTRRSPTCGPARLRPGAEAPARRALPGAKRLGHGKGYSYPHDDALGVRRPAVPARRAARTRVLRADRARQRARGLGPAGQDPPDRPRRDVTAREPRSARRRGSLC